MAVLCCSNCDWYDRNSTHYMNSNLHKCKADSSWKSPTDSCNNHSRLDMSSNSSYGKEFKQSGCFITLIVSKILNFADDCEVLNTLREFRENVLKCDFKYIPVLLQYDLMAPAICDNLIQYENKYECSINIVNNFITPCINYIKEGFLDEAAETIENMTSYLCEMFNLECLKPKRNMEYDTRILGKGRRIVKNFGPLKSAY